MKRRCSRKRHDSGDQRKQLEIDKRKLETEKGAESRHAEDLSTRNQNLEGKKVALQQEKNNFKGLRTYSPRNKGLW